MTAEKSCPAHVILTARKNLSEYSEMRFFAPLRMTDSRFVIGSGAKQSRLSRLYLDCFVPRNDGFTMLVIIRPAMTNWCNLTERDKQFYNFKIISDSRNMNNKKS